MALRRYSGSTTPSIRFDCAASHGKTSLLRSTGPGSLRESSRPGGRRVLGGGRRAASDSYETRSPDGVSGLALQALIVNTLLRGLPFVMRPPADPGSLRRSRRRYRVGILSSRKPVAVGVAGLLSLVVYVALAFSWFERGMVLRVVEPIVIVLLTLAVAAALRRVWLSVLLRKGSLDEAQTLLFRSLHRLRLHPELRDPHAGASEVPVAIVYQISGTASATHAEPRRPIVLFSRLPAGAVIVTGTDSRVTLAFSNGNRCEVGPAARVNLTGKDCVGPARRLSPVPILPFVPRTVVEARKPRASRPFACEPTRSEACIRTTAPQCCRRRRSFVSRHRTARSMRSESWTRTDAAVFESTIRSGSASVPPES